MPTGHGFSLGGSDDTGTEGRSLSLTTPAFGPCQLELSVDGAKEYRNGESVKLHLETDSPALVALGALDTALYAAGSKSHKPLNMGKVCPDPLPSPPTPPWLIPLLP